MHILIILLLLLFLQNQNGTPIPLPLAQIQISERTLIYEETSSDAEVITRARRGDVLPVYEIEGVWGRVEGGWLRMEDQTLEPAVVHFSAIVLDRLTPAADLDAVEQTLLEIEVGQMVGVTAIFGDYALVYTELIAGWVRVDDLRIDFPTPELVSFIEQDAYVKVEQSHFYAQPDLNSEVVSVQLLGRRVTVLYHQDGWVLVRTGYDLGWSRSENFDFVPRAQAQAEMNAGPVNLRETPVNGRVIAVLDYLESILVVGRNSDDNWLYIRRLSGVEGWVSARYVNFEGSIDDLPVIAAN